MNPWTNGQASMNGHSLNGHQSPMNHPMNTGAYSPMASGPIVTRQSSRSWDSRGSQQSPSSFSQSMISQQSPMQIGIWGTSSNGSTFSPWQQPSNGAGGTATPSMQWNTAGLPEKRSMSMSYRTAPHSVNNAAAAMSAQSWGHQVDQQTPWDTGDQQAPQPSPASLPNGADRGMNGNYRWNPNATPWRQPEVSQASNDWTNTAATLLSQSAMLPSQPMNGAQSRHSGWNNSPDQQSHDNYGLPVNTGNNHWVANHQSYRRPETLETDKTDLVWQDPNIKMKKAMRDTGTAIWGNPDLQKPIREIRHWKSPEQAEFAQAMANGADWTALGHPEHPGHAQSGWGEPDDAGSRMVPWNMHQPWSDAHDDREPDMTIPNMAQTLGTSSIMDTLDVAMSMNPQLTNQIKEQFSGAINRNWIIPKVLSEPISVNTAILHQLVKRMYNKENEMLQLRNGSLSPTTNEKKKTNILMETKQTKDQLLDIQRVICGSLPLNSGLATTPVDGQSRLTQWKKNGNAMAAKNKECGNGNNRDVHALTQAALGLSLHSPQDCWKKGSLEWSPPDHRDSVRKDSNDGYSNGPYVQEFIPGKKWEWRNPNKIAEDPNATPGSCKPNPLLTSSSSLLLQSSNNLKEKSPISLDLNHYDDRVGKQLPSPHSQCATSPVMSPNSDTNLSRYWLLFQLDSRIPSLHFQQMCYHAGRVVDIRMIGSQIACVKFNAGLERTIQNIKNEYPFLMDQLRIVSDDEFPKIIKQANTMNITSDPLPHPELMNSPWANSHHMYHADPARPY